VLVAPADEADARLLLANAEADADADLQEPS
jgi:hypothetical protein